MKLTCMSGGAEPRGWSDWIWLAGKARWGWAAKRTISCAGLWKPPTYVQRCDGLQFAFDGLIDTAITGGFEGFLQRGQRQLFGVSGVGDERAFAGYGIDPAGGDGDDVIEEARWDES